MSTVLALLRWRDGQREADFYGAALLFGLAVAHHPNDVLLAPGVIAFVWMTDRRWLLDLRRTAAAIILAAAAFLPYVYLIRPDQPACALRAGTGAQSVGCRAHHDRGRVSGKRVPVQSRRRARFAAPDGSFVDRRRVDVARLCGARRRPRIPHKSPPPARRPVGARSHRAAGVRPELRRPRHRGVLHPGILAGVDRRRPRRRVRRACCRQTRSALGTRRRDRVCAPSAVVRRQPRPRGEPPRPRRHDAVGRCPHQRASARRRSSSKKTGSSIRSFDTNCSAKRLPPGRVRRGALQRSSRSKVDRLDGVTHRCLCVPAESRPASVDGLAHRSPARARIVRVVRRKPAAGFDRRHRRAGRAERGDGRGARGALRRLGLGSGVEAGLVHRVRRPRRTRRRCSNGAQAMERHRASVQVARGESGSA